MEKIELINLQKYFDSNPVLRDVNLSVREGETLVVIGRSGCGKTKLVNESGLTFSLGKPEGYKLGTLNYNWWFTEKAIFVDMAGRLCNPQEDDDHRPDPQPVPLRLRTVTVPSF